MLNFVNFDAIFDVWNFTFNLKNTQNYYDTFLAQLRKQNMNHYIATAPQLKSWHIKTLEIFKWSTSRINIFLDRFGRRKPPPCQSCTFEPIEIGANILFVSIVDATIHRDRTIFLQRSLWYNYDKSWYETQTYIE